MARTKKEIKEKPKREEKAPIKEIKKEEEIEELEEDEELEEPENIIEESSSMPVRRYPFMRRAAPTIRIQPLEAPLEIELENLPTPKRNNEENKDQYKPTPEKNYSIQQKYELPGGASYQQIAPKQITSPAPSFSPAITPDFQNQQNQSQGFGNTAPGYPGQESNERKYDSGLEREAKEQEKRRREF